MGAKYSCVSPGILLQLKNRSLKVDDDFIALRPGQHYYNENVFEANELFTIISVLQTKKRVLKTRHIKNGSVVVPFFDLNLFSITKNIILRHTVSQKHFFKIWSTITPHRLFNEAVLDDIEQNLNDA